MAFFQKVPRDNDTPAHVLKINPQNAIGVEILHQNLSIFEMLSKKENKHKGGRFRLLALNKEV